jgi:hypothetical protein
LRAGRGGRQREGGEGSIAQCHIVFPLPDVCINRGADPPVRSRPPGRLVEGRSNLILREKSGTRASRADQGVRPTNYAECASAQKLCGIGLDSPWVRLDLRVRPRRWHEQRRPPPQKRRTSHFDAEYSLWHAVGVSCREKPGSPMNSGIGGLLRGTAG